MEREKYDIRTLTDGHVALRNFLATQPASAIPNDMLVRLSRIERQLRPVTELVNQRKAAFAHELGVPVSADGQRYIVPDGDEADGQERYDQFQEKVNEWLDTEYPLNVESIPLDEAAHAMPALSWLHFVLMPFAFSV